MSAALRDKRLWTLVAVSILASVPVVLAPFSFDNSINQILALDWLQRGRVLFIHSFDHNFPGIVFIHAICAFILGPSPLSYRLFDVFVQIAFAVCSYLFLKRYFTNLVPFLAALLYVLFYVSAGPIEYGQRDVYASILVLIALSYFIAHRASTMALVYVGVLIGISTLIRPTSAIVLIVPLVINDNRQSWFRAASKRFAVLGLAFFLPILIVLLYYSRFDGGLSRAYHLAILFNLEVHQKINSTESFWKQSAHYIFVIGFGCVAAWQLSAQTWLRYRDEFKLYAAVALSGLLSIILQQKYFVNHFTLVAMLLMPLTAVGINTVAGHFQSLPVRATVLFICLALCVLPFRASSFVRSNKTSNQLYERLYDSDADAAVGNYLSRNLKHSEEIEICSLDPTLRLESHYRCVGGYPSMHLLAETPFFTAGGNPEFSVDQRQWQKEYVQTLTASKPARIIIARSMRYWAVPNFDQVLHSLPGFDSLLIRNYEFDTLIGGYSIYKLLLNNDSSKLIR
jgi:4-amino-4-deoxy-L-arabinose transferase-like glycosyltransferase